ncbi:hypothetical protein GCM10022254_02080 [Actinomadura meridiana]|uniref:Uncharacterized protein n=1 Tax=Actinomadura meridiana TaxID=559626 RepID=A0ABP8BRP0_9ACTN
MHLRDHYRSGTPFIAVHDALAALDFYRTAFDADVLARLAAPTAARCTPPPSSTAP